ncbi:MAG: hypothetical protein KAQ63_03440, partial [Candidatus Moranbacteria bacterium]|nr:hypothetical protein [Candidatus Moranbacteria bacterium]
VMKNKSAVDILDKNYGEPLGADRLTGAELAGEPDRVSAPVSKLDQAEINNREQLRDYIVSLIGETEEAPRAASNLSPAETVEDFIKRAERLKLESL